ncbi:unnamed protein product, partial [Medioppia subpectinata]
MSQTSSRPPSEANNRAYWFASAPKQTATGMRAVGGNDYQLPVDITDTAGDECLCADKCPIAQRGRQIMLNNNANQMNNNNYYNTSDSPHLLMDALNLQISNRNYRKVIRPRYQATSASNPATPHTDTYWFAQTGVEPVVSPDTDGRDGLKFEEKLRLCRERQEDERQRRLQDIE